VILGKNDLTPSLTDKERRKLKEEIKLGPTKEGSVERTSGLLLKLDQQT
jgi:hypothetical protein